VGNADRNQRYGYATTPGGETGWQASAIGKLPGDHFALRLP